MDDFEQTSADRFSATRDGSIAPANLAVHYLPRLRAFVCARLGADLRARVDESDIVQSVCRELCNGEQRLQFDSERQFRAWLFSAALNKIRDKARYWGREKRSAEHEQPADSRIDLDQRLAGLAGVFTPSRIASAREEAERIEDVIANLPDDYRAVIALTRIAGLDYRQAGEELGRSPDATRVLLGRALRRLAGELKKA